MSFMLECYLGLKIFLIRPGPGGGGVHGGPAGAGGRGGDGVRQEAAGGRGRGGGGVQRRRVQGGGGVHHDPQDRAQVRQHVEQLLHRHRGEG